MESKGKLREIDIKNRTCYYFDGIIGVMDRDRDFDFSDILLDEKSYKQKFEKILIYDISYKPSTGAKPLRFRFNEIDRFNKTHNGIRSLVLFDDAWFDKSCDKIKYLIIENVVLQIVLIIILGKSELIHIILYHSDNVIILKSVVNKDKNNYYNNKFLERFE